MSLFLRWLFLFFFSLTGFIPVGQAEVTAPGAGEASVSPRCEADVARNREIIANCNANWSNWGIDPQPPANELRSMDECNSGVISSGGNFLRGCASAVAAPFVFVGTLGALGIAHLATQEDTNSDRYIFANGTQQEILARLAENWMIENCGLGSVREAEFIDQNCGSRAEDHIEGSRDCNPFLEQLREQQACRRTSETRQAYREASLGLERQASVIFSEQQEINRNRENHESAVREIQQDCGVHINPYRRNIIARFGTVQSLTREMIHQLQPNAENVNAFNDCVQNHPSSNEEIVQSLMQESSGLIDAAVSEYESFSCYNATIRNELYCDVAAVVLSGGTLAAKSLTRLGRRGIAGALPDASDVAGALVRFRQNPDFANVIGTAREALGRELSDQEQAALYRAHLVGRGQPGADGTPAVVGNYTEAQIREKTRILSETFETPAERRLLLESGAAGDNSLATEMFRDAWRSNDFSGDLQFASAEFSQADGSVARLPVRILERNEDGSLEILTQGADGQLVRMTYPRDSLRSVRLSGASREFFQGQIRERFDTLASSGQNITVTSLSGNTYQGTSGGIIRMGDSDVLVLRNAAGEEQLVRLDRLNLESARQVETPSGPRPGQGNPIAANAPPQFRDVVDGSSVSINSRSGNTYTGVYEGVHELNGDQILVLRQPDGQVVSLRMDRLDPETLRSLGVSPEVSARGPPGLAQPRARIVEEYTASSGARVFASYEDPAYTSFLSQSINNVWERTGLNPATFDPNNPAQRAALFDSWRDDIVPTIESRHSGPEYDAIRNRIINTGGNRASVGDIVANQAAVCRELSICANGLFAEYGIQARVVTGSLEGALGHGRHAWIELYDPHTDRLLGIVDSNFTRSFHPSYEDYQRHVQGTVTPEVRTVIAEPIHY